MIQSFANILNCGTQRKYGRFPVITSNVILRTYNIKRGNATGTACVIDRENKQYLVTARHVVEGVKSKDQIAFSFERRWHTIDIEVVGIGVGDLDVAILACPLRLSPTHQLEASTRGLAYGQLVYFLGFPFGWNGGGEDLNRGCPLPFVKSGVLSTFYKNDNRSLFYIDGYGNRGFSGGPVVFVPGERQSSEATPFQLAGIIVNYPMPLESQRPILDKRGNGLDAYFIENPGLVAAVNISSVTEIIDSNPVGFQLPLSEATH